MNIEIYAVHDSAVGAYNRPLFFRSRGEAVRSFEVAVKAEANGFLTHPDHYSFWLVGSFDETTGKLVSVEPQRVCGARDFVVAPS